MGASLGERVRGRTLAGVVGVVRAVIVLYLFQALARMRGCDESGSG
jgi:hypothetical protein